MSFYKLVYIKGISNLDTWKFSSKQEQYNYFNGLQGYQVDDYYPPHYTNSIKFDKNDIDYSTTNYNYCLLYFNEKYYCYFITGIHYINEDIYTLSLEMDTIQTHMFDISFNYSIMDRMCIKRKLANGNINRDYIRENLSEGEFVKSSYLESNCHKYIMITSRTDLSQGNVSSHILNQNYVEMGNGLYKYLLLLPNDELLENKSLLYQGKYTINYTYLSGNTGSVQFTYAQLANCISFLCESADVVDIVYIDNSPFLDGYLERVDSVIETNYGTQENPIYYSNYIINIEATTELSFSFSANIEGYPFSFNFDVFKNIFGQLWLPMPININGTLISQQSVNTSKTEPFSIKYIPALLDENYINIKYGEKMNFSTYPLYKSKVDKFIHYSFYDFVSFSRIYMINDDENKLEDVYITKVLCNSIQNLERYTDAWLEFKSQNYATLKSGIKTNMLLDTAGTFLGGIRSTSGIANGETAFSKTSMTNPRLTASKAVLQVGKTLNDFLTTKGNLEHTPDKRNLGNQYSSDYVSRSTKIFTEVDCVSDIEQVARKLEWYGYKVNYNFGNINLFTNSDVNNRYYYNIVKCKEISIDFTSNIKSIDILNNIEDRLKNGIRLWDKSHNTNMLDNLIYDNVENDFVVE